MSSQFYLSAFADEIDPSLDVQMDVLNHFGIKYIEMRGVNGKNLTDYCLDDVRDIKRQLDKRGFRLSAIGSPIGKIGIKDDFEPHLAKFKHTLKIAEIMEAKYIRMFSFYMPKGEAPEQYRDEVLDRWNAFMHAAEGTGVILLHENEKDIYGDTPERCLDLLKSLNSSNVRMTFDPANFVQCDVETYPKAYEMLKDYIEYMHIKDALYNNHQVVPAGLGDGRVKDILNALKERGFIGFLSLEPHLGNFVGFSALEQNAVDADMPDGGPRLFGIAYNALKALL